MQVWRISRYPALDGIGGMVAGRWHSRGHPVTYCAVDAATALVEWIVHLELAPDEIPKTIPYLVIDIPDDIRAERVDVDNLPATWRADLSVTQPIGDEWLTSRRTPLLRVPSAVVPETENVLLNPLHPDAKRIRMARALNQPFDPRLLVGRTK